MVKEIKEMKLYRGVGGTKKDTKNIGTYYTSSKEEAEFYGNDIITIEHDGRMLMSVKESDLDDYLSEWLESLDDSGKEYQKSTKAYFQNQQSEIIAAEDAKSRGYAGIIMTDICGEVSESCDYVILF